MVERMAWKRAGKQQGEAEWLASRHAEARLNERIDQRAGRSDRSGQPGLRRTSSTARSPSENCFRKSCDSARRNEAISVSGVAGRRREDRGADAPPPVAEGAEMSLRIHESMINNLAFDALAGRTVYEEKVQAAAIDALGKLPEKMKGDEDGKPWAITFAPRQPISVTFADDGFKITLRGVRFLQGPGRPSGHERFGQLQDRKVGRRIQGGASRRHRGASP